MAIASTDSLWKTERVKINISLLSAGLVTSLVAGEPVQTTTAPTRSPGFDEQSWFGPPYLQFARRASDTELPNYPLGLISYNHTFSSDFDSLPGEVSADRFNLWAPVAPLNFNNLHLFAFLNYNATNFNTTAPANSIMLPEDGLNSLSLPVVFIHDLSNKWMWGAMVMPTYAGSASSSDNFTVSAGLGLGYSYSENLEVFAGGYYAHDYGDDIFIPGIAFIWRPAPKWEASLLGPIGGVSYSVNENFLLSLYGRYRSPTWFVKADAAGPDRNVNMTSLQVGLKAEYHLSTKLWGYVAGGYAFAQELEVETTANNTLQKSDIDPSPFIECGLDLRF